ncbi:Hypothetical protein Minf_1721 [Methylacidiphilum infernorum V4]|uniref:Uncharacterized protein n=1 Tax=Methylacidiphilum infernorum (isolate V4) TaxID=481448 RepID=B3DX66_METI4|nr:Hypothetical protein Minf_1721 [Methylacidiphilum infernorum V4]
MLIFSQSNSLFFYLNQDRQDHGEKGLFSRFPWKRKAWLRSMKACLF